MLPRDQAQLLLAAVRPLVLNHGLSQSITPNHVCVTEDGLRQLDIREGALDDHITTLYDGKDYQADGQAVHVFLRDKLARYAGLGWAEQEAMRKEAQADLAVGG